MGVPRAGSRSMVAYMTAWLVHITKLFDRITVEQVGYKHIKPNKPRNTICQVSSVLSHRSDSTRSTCQCASKKHK